MNAIAQSMQGFGSVRAVTLSVVGVILLVVFGFLSVRLTSPVMSPLYGNLAPEDSGVIVTELGGMGIPFDIASGGSQILVQSGDVLRVRMALAQKGLPNRGSITGYEIFDKDTPLGTSSFVLNVNLLRALEGELGRTISSLSSIKSARIHLVMPKRELFRKGRVKPSASVVLTLNNLTKVPKKEAVAVKHLVSSAVPGLSPSRVTIIDSRGKILARGASEDDEEDGGGVLGGNAMETRQNMELKLKKAVENILEQAVGPEKVHAEISVEMNFDRKTTNSESFDPDGLVPRSVQTTEETTNSNEGGGGQVSAGTNLPNSSAGGSSNSNSSSLQRTDEVTNYEVSKTLTSTVSEVGEVKRITVAVLVDGSYKLEKNEEDDTETSIYVPRTDDELDKFKTLVQTAIGFNSERGDKVELINMQFQNDADQFIEEEGAFNWLKRDLDSILKTVMVGIVAILTIMLVIRPLVNRAFEISGADIENEEANAAAMPNMGSMAYNQMSDNEDIDLDIIQSKMDTAPAKKVNDLIENNPDETLSVIRTWLAQKPN